MYNVSLQTLETKKLLKCVFKEDHTSAIKYEEEIVL